MLCCVVAHHTTPHHTTSRHGMGPTYRSIERVGVFEWVELDGEGGGVDPLVRHK